MSAHLTELAFSSLALHESLQNSLRNAGFEFCTPIQQQSLPILLSGRDVAGQAQTGTGKTIAFLLATFQRLLEDEPFPNWDGKQPRAFILAPTRELAIQIANDAILLNKESGLRIVVAHGGKDYEKQKSAILSGVEIMVAKPVGLLE